MTQLLSAITTLAIVLIAMAVIVRIVSIEDALKMIGRAVLLFILALVAVCILRGLLLDVIGPWLASSLPVLKSALGWVLIAAVIIGSLAIVLHLASRRSEP